MEQAPGNDSSAAVAVAATNTPPADSGFVEATSALRLNPNPSVPVPAPAARSPPARAQRPSVKVTFSDIDVAKANRKHAVIRRPGEMTPLTYKPGSPELPQAGFVAPPRRLQQHHHHQQLLQKHQNPAMASIQSANGGQNINGANAGRAAAAAVAVDADADAGADGGPRPRAMQDLKLVIPNDSSDSDTNGTGSSSNDSAVAGVVWTDSGGKGYENTREARQPDRADSGEVAGLSDELEVSAD